VHYSSEEGRFKSSDEESKESAVAQLLFKAIMNDNTSTINSGSNFICLESQHSNQEVLPPVIIPSESPVRQSEEAGGQQRLASFTNPISHLESHSIQRREGSGGGHNEDSYLQSSSLIMGTGFDSHGMMNPR
jgi:hypothetical protein